MKCDDFEGTGPDEQSDAVGIVVKSGATGEGTPRAVAFVWGARVRPAPSLPYGRWKTHVRPAA